MLIEQEAVQKLHPYGILPKHLVCIRDNETFARRVAEFIKLAWDHPRIWVSTTPDRRVCARCGQGFGLLCAECETDLRVP